MPAPQSRDLCTHFDAASHGMHSSGLMNTSCLSLRNDNRTEIGLYTHIPRKGSSLS
jgi:hypothetical protein